MAIFEDAMKGGNIVTGLAMVGGAKVKFRNKLVSFGFAGLFSGILNGGVAMSGPPIVLFLTNEGYENWFCLVRFSVWLFLNRSMNPLSEN